MSKIPSDPDTTEQQFKGQGVKHGTERDFWSRWPSRQAPAASAQRASRASTFGDGNDLYGDTLLPQKKELHCVTLNLYSITSLQNTMNRP